MVLVAVRHALDGLGQPLASVHTGPPVLELLLLVVPPAPPPPPPELQLHPGDAATTAAPTARAQKN
jgi:hypothetical protein